MPSRVLPNPGTMTLYRRRHLLKELIYWDQHKTLSVGILVPDLPSSTNEEWLVLSSKFVAYWNFPAKPFGSGPQWGVSRLRYPMLHKPYLINGSPLREEQGIWLTYRRTPVAYLVSIPAYHAWAHHKLVI